MRRYLFSFSLLAFVIFTCVSASAQTPDQAVSHFKKALKLTSSGDVDGAIEEYSRAIAISSQLQPQRGASRNPAQSFAGAEEAREFTDTGIRVIDPFTAHAYNNRGLLRYNRTDYFGAIEDFNAAERIKPSLEAIYLNRSAAFRATGNTQAALADLDRAIALKKDFFQAYNNRGSLHHDLGHDKQALSDLDRAIQLKDDVADTYYLRAYAYLAVDNWNASLKDFDRAIELAPGMAWAYQGRGTVFMKKGMMQEAISDFDRSLELNPQMVWAYLNRGLAKVYLGDEAGAQSDFDQCLKLKPELKAQLDDKIDLARELRQRGKQ